MADEKRRKKQKKQEISLPNNEDADQASSGILISFSILFSFRI
jgi:hypothetical protein